MTESLETRRNAATCKRIAEEWMALKDCPSHVERYEVAMACHDAILSSFNRNDEQRRKYMKDAQAVLDEFKTKLQLEIDSLKRRLLEGGISADERSNASAQLTEAQSIADLLAMVEGGTL